MHIAAAGNRPGVAQGFCGRINSPDVVGTAHLGLQCHRGSTPGPEVLTGQVTAAEFGQQRVGVTGRKALGSLPVVDHEQPGA